MAHVSKPQPFPPHLTRNTSPSTGLSYICFTPSLPPRKLFLCFHGWACAATDFVYLLSALAESDTRNLYIAINLPGHGGSPKSICPTPGVAEFAAVANALRWEVSPAGGLIETVLVGHSMGCRMALEAFVQERGGVSGIVLIDGSWVGRNPEVHAAPVVWDREAEIRRMNERIGMFGPLTPEGFKEEVGRGLRGVDLEYEYELSRRYIEWDRESMEGTLEVVGGEGEDVRVLVVQSTQGRGANRRMLERGEEGPWVPFVRGKVGSGRFENVVIEGCGHWPHVDKVEEVARIVSAFTTD